MKKVLGTVKVKVVSKMMLLTFVVESLLICVFFLAPRDQLLQRNKPATSQAAGYPKQPATSSQPATPALYSPAPVIICSS
jgi:hypothetical protein